jgi:hypothetical protein
MGECHGFFGWYVARMHGKDELLHKYPAGEHPSSRWKYGLSAI